MSRTDLTTRSCLVLAALLLPACSAFVAPGDEPVLHDSLGPRLTTTAITAERRVIIGHDDGSIVAEPPPDAAQEVAAAFAAALAATEGEIEDEALAVADRVTRETMQLARRSQGVIFFRDASYRLAEASFNASQRDRDGADAHKEWLGEFRNLVGVAQALITFELEQNPTLATGADEEAGAQRFARTGPDPVQTEHTLEVSFVDPARAHQTVDALLSDGFLGEEVHALSLELDADGVGCAEFTVPADWSYVLLRASDSRPRLIRVAMRCRI